MVAWSICRTFQSHFKLSTAWLFHFQLCCNNKKLVETAEFGNFDCELINLVILVALCARWWQHSMQCVQSTVLHSCTPNLLNWIMNVFDVIRHFDVLRHWFPYFFCFVIPIDETNMHTMDLFHLLLLGSPLFYWTQIQCWLMNTKAANNDFMFYSCQTTEK